ncbi:MAG: acyl-ACP--UDP-N-acetylglucosamine O-acyltransferase [Pseudomonadota bacterium]
MISASSIVSENANVHPSVKVGPFCVIGDNVEIGEGTVIHSHAVLKGHTKIGKNNEIFQFCTIGEDCQDKKYAGETTYLEIGDDNVFRESCTIHRGTVQDNATTSIGSRNLFMIATHVAHDCIVGDDCIFANNATLAGHVKIGDFAILGGLTAVHQFCQIGAHAMAGGGSIILRDIPPYVMYNGVKQIPQGINSEGLKRRGFTSDEILSIKRAYKTIYRNNNSIDEAREMIAQMAEEHDVLKIMHDFLQHNVRGLAR